MAMELSSAQSGFFSTSTQDYGKEDTIITLQYDSAVRHRFKTLIGICILITILTHWIQIFDSGWLSLMILFTIVLILYYHYRIRRRVQISRVGITENASGRDWCWTYSDIAEVTEYQTESLDSMPSRRIVIEHKSSHDIAFDNQMKGYDDAVAIIKANWCTTPDRRIEHKRIRFFILKFW